MDLINALFPDDPEVFLGRLVVLFVLGTIVWLLIGAVRARRADHVTVCAANALIAFAWFAVWAITGGAVPFGLHALAISVVLLMLTLLIPRKRP